MTDKTEGLEVVAKLHPSNRKAISMEDFCEQPAWVQADWLLGKDLCTVESAQAAVAAEREHIKQHAMLAMQCLSANDQRITALESTLGVAREELKDVRDFRPNDSTNAAIALIDTTLGAKT